MRRFRLSPSDLGCVGGALHRPECVLATACGDLYVSDERGGVTRARAAAPGPEAVDYGAVRNVLTALQGRRVRIALMSTIGATDRKGWHDWKRRGERLVRVSGHDYTIVRPSWFDYNAADQHRLVMLQGDTRLTGTPRDGAIARSPLAKVLVRSLRSPAALRKTFELNAEIRPNRRPTT